MGWRDGIRIATKPAAVAAVLYWLHPGAEGGEKEDSDDRLTVHHRPVPDETQCPAERHRLVGEGAHPDGDPRRADDGPDEGSAIVPPDAHGFRIRFLPGAEPGAAQNRAHFDLTSASPEEQRRTVARALERTHFHLHAFRLAYDVETGEATLEEHVRIVETIIAGDADGAEAAMTEHLRAAQERLSTRTPE